MNKPKQCENCAFESGYPACLKCQKCSAQSQYARQQPPLPLKRMTYGELIRRMTDMQLATVLGCRQCIHTDNREACQGSDCHVGIVAWLEKEVSSGVIKA